MFEQPTIDDFLALIDWHIAKALKAAHQEVNRVRAEFNKGGAFNSGRRIIFSIEAAKKEFDAGIDAVLGELKRTIRKTKLNPKDLRDRAAERLMKFANDAKSAAQVGDVTMGVDVFGQLRAFDQHLQFALRQFDIGFFEPVEPEVPPMANAITIGTMTGSVIQQESPGDLNG